MYDIIKATILEQQFELTLMLDRINTTWIEGAIDDGQRLELIQMAQRNAKVENASKPVKEQISYILEILEKQGKTIEILMDEIRAIGGDVPAQPPVEEFPEWSPWNGLGKCPWQMGSKVSHAGSLWLSGVEDNIWEPGAPGVYEFIWQNITDEMTEKVKGRIDSAE